MNHRLRASLGIALLAFVPLACETPTNGTPGFPPPSDPGEGAGAPDPVDPQEVVQIPDAIKDEAQGDMAQAPGPVATPGTDTASVHQMIGSVILRSLGGNTVHIRPANIRSTPTAVIEFGQLSTTGPTAMTFTIDVPKGMNFQVSDGAGRPDSVLGLTPGNNEVRLVREGTGVRFEATNASRARKTSRENPHASLPQAGTPRVQAEKIGEDTKHLRIWANLGDVRSSFLLTEKP